MILVGIIGFSCAALSIFNNVILFYVFIIAARSSLPIGGYLTYLTGLSVCDVYAEYFELEWLFRVWHYCLPMAFTISNITFTTAAFLLVAATIERYVQTIKTRRLKQLWQLMSKNRRSGIFLALFFGILFRGTIFELEHCTGLARMGVELSELSKNWYFDSIWRFWTRRAITIFLPFFILAYCNTAIVCSIQTEEEIKSYRYNLQKQLSPKSIIVLDVASEMDKNSNPHTRYPLSYNKYKYLSIYNGLTNEGFGQITRENSMARKSHRVRAATRMLILVVTCYLFTNLLDVFIATWEYIDRNSLAARPGFYTIVTDISSLLSVISSSARLSIYLLVGDPLLRYQDIQIKKCLRGIWHCLTPFCHNSSEKP